MKRYDDPALEPPLKPLVQRSVERSLSGLRIGTGTGTPLPGERPRLMVAARVLGASGQPWLWRQVHGLDAFDRRLLCWERRTPAGADPRCDLFGGCAVDVLPRPAAPYDGPRRWALRLANARSGNFYAARGADRSALQAAVEAHAPHALLCYFGDVAMHLLPVAQQAGVPLVAYLHGDFLFASHRWYRASLRRCLPGFAALVVVTEAERRWALACGMPADKVHVVPCGAPTDVFQPADETVRTARDGTIDFVMCSRLVAEKGCHLTLQAFARAFAGDTAASPQARLQVYGDGPDRAALELQARSLGLGARVTFHGYVGEAALARRLPAHDVFVQHSLGKEGSPVSIAEAMACGLPVVATPVGGITAQVLPDLTGVLVAPHDVPAMAQAMQRLAADAGLRRAFGGAARERALAGFDSARLTARLSRIVMAAALQSAGRRATR